MLGARARRPHWLITKYDHSKMSALTISLGANGEALAVFSFEEEAEMFLHLRGVALEDGWSVRQTSVGELVSVLYGPCANARKVVLDPAPAVGKRALVVIPSMHRNPFLQGLLGEGPSSLHLVPNRSPRPAIRLENNGIA
jgi:hypothetical protein